MPRRLCQPDGAAEMPRARSLPVRLPAPRVLLLWIAGTVGVLAAGGLLFAWSGIYNVAASSGHFAITRAFLTFGLHSSVRTHSIGIEVPPLDGPDLVRLGAGHFAGGCAPCHGAPGEPRNPMMDSMLPPPPRLSDAVGDWETRELFWIVKHGLKYTAMPAWVALPRDDEVWAVIAFLRQLPGLSAEDYRTLANFDAAEGSVAEPHGRSTFLEALAACARCHGDANSAPTSHLVPKLAGQSPAYMQSALRHYASGMRFSGIMQPVAALLDEAAIERFSQYYAALDAVGGEAADESSPGEQIERGRSIATAGVPEAGIPPCLSCHGDRAADIFPRLQNQNAPYILTQLRLFKQGNRGLTATAAIMQAIARRLTDQQMQDTAAYFESLPAARQGELGEEASAAAEAPSP